jgi:hypothetical protein
LPVTFLGWTLVDERGGRAIPNGAALCEANVFKGFKRERVKVPTVLVQTVECLIAYETIKLYIETTNPFTL